MTTPKLTAISLGWGIQSWTLVAMVALGELPPVDFAIHSDTTWERQTTYRFALQWTPWLEERGVKVVTVNDSQQAAKVTTADQNSPWFTQGSILLPVYTQMQNDIYEPETEWVWDEDGEEYEIETGHNNPIIPLKNGASEVVVPAMTFTAKDGQLRRQCTSRWKIQPMRRYISAELKRRGLRKSPGIVEQWLGITTDEWHRAKDSDVKYIVHRYPLLDLGMSRGDCMQWLADHDLPSPGKSTCTFCPYHSKAAWKRMKQEGGPDWQQAVEIDAAIRDKRPPFDLFVHPARLPLPEAVSIPEDYGYTQPAMFDVDEECDSGFCFL